MMNSKRLKSDQPKIVDDNKRFVEEFANPHSWLLMADNLHEQATEIYKRKIDSSITTKLNQKNEIMQRIRGTDKSVFLLGGFALENAIKAFLVYENPNWVSNGRLSSRLKSHSLTALQGQSELIPYKHSYITVLEEFESGLDSWFRYPCALTIKDTKKEQRLNEDLWLGYSKLMRAYGKKLGMLLNKGWTGPHGAYGRWTTEGQWMGCQKPFSTILTLRASSV